MTIGFWKQLGSVILGVDSDNVGHISFCQFRKYVLQSTLVEFCEKTYLELDMVGEIEKHGMKVSVVTWEIIRKAYFE